MASFLLSLSQTTGEASYMFWWYSEDTLWRDQGVRNWSILSITSREWSTAMLVHHPRSKSFSPSQAFRWQQSWLTSWMQSHERSWARTTQLSHYWTSDPQKLCDNKSLLVYTTKFGVIYYAAMDSISILSINSSGFYLHYTYKVVVTYSSLPRQ